MAPGVSAPRGRLLLVEDEDALRGLLARVLERAGFLVEATALGQEAIATFEREPASYAAAVIDLTLPDMGGEAVMGRLLELRPDLTVVIASGLAGGVPAQVAGQNRVTFLQKPFLPARLVEQLKPVLAGEATAADQSSSPSTAS